jgi:hypothetical protein
MALRVLEKKRRTCRLVPDSVWRRESSRAYDFADPEPETAWDNEIERRVKEIESASEKGIPAERALNKARQALIATHRLPSARTRYP